MSACLLQGVSAQFNVSGPGFLPDENGMNPDAPQPKNVAPNVTAGTVVKDCPECPEMVVIPAGSFVMGSVKNVDEQPPHAVTVRSFLIGKTEVTQKQWTDVMGNSPSYFYGCGQDCPVEAVSWDDVGKFIYKLNMKTGQKYRLPSEAEWEYSARSGTTTEWSFGNDESRLGDYAWYSGNSDGKSHAVMQKLPNKFGLYDMHGNVWEWVADCYHINYQNAPLNGSSWISSCNGEYAAMRGGSWDLRTNYSRSAFRQKTSPDSRHYNLGFRLARDL